MEKQNDGGPAFPNGDSGGGPTSGMSLRDYFAAKALQGFLANPKTAEQMQAFREDGESFASMHGRMSNVVFQLADAMLAAREALPKS